MKTEALQIVGDEYQLGGRPFQILSGAIHYFRVLPEYWKDRLLKLQAMGLNTVETYVCWNLHEPTPGEFDFSGRLDIAAFIRQASELGLRAIVRPGPYICSEWDFGGLPAWLLRDPKMTVRCSYPPFLEAVDRFFEALLPHVAPLQSTNGGPVIALQVENEYGAYGSDTAYLAHLEEKIRACGIDSLLFVSDHHYLDVLPELFKTANFGGRPEEQFAALRKYQPTGPLTCMEFWCGWFDQYGKPRPERDPQELASVLDAMLKMGASVNFYMFHGGTNFGFTNGANCDADKFDPRPTSYDYGALLDEAGEITPKYEACREVFARHLGFPPMAQDAFPTPPRLETAKFTPTRAVSLFDVLDQLGEPTRSLTPLSMEEVGQNFGFLLYRTRIDWKASDQTLTLRGVHDRAWVFVDGKPAGIVNRDDTSPVVTINTEQSGATLDILVENMGRTNFGPWLHDRKGLTEGVILDRKYLFGWKIYSLPFDSFEALPSRQQLIARGVPAFYESVIQVSEPRDTFLNLSAWTKGVCFINGFNLGRYWNVGPHQSLFVPSPLLRRGENRISLFELEEAGEWLQFEKAPEYRVAPRPDQNPPA